MRWRLGDRWSDLDHLRGRTPQEILDAVFVVGLAMATVILQI